MSFSGDRQPEPVSPPPRRTKPALAITVPSAASPNASLTLTAVARPSLGKPFDARRQRRQGHGKETREQKMIPIAADASTQCTRGFQSAVLPEHTPASTIGLSARFIGRASRLHSRCAVVRGRRLVVRGGRVVLGLTTGLVGGTAGLHRVVIDLAPGFVRRFCCFDRVIRRCGESNRRQRCCNKHRKNLFHVEFSIQLRIQQNCQRMTRIYRTALRFYCPGLRKFLDTCSFL
jgi:hypothetical protein